MKKDKQQMIIKAAIRIFSRKGYQYAIIGEIAKDAGVSKGLVHFYFENKLDLLLSVILFLSKTINEMIQQKCSLSKDPFVKLHMMAQIFQDLVRQNENLYWGHILSERLPDIEEIKSKKLKKKYSEILDETKKMKGLFDDIIHQGQRQGLIDSSLKPQMIGQIIRGAGQRLYADLELKQKGNKHVGYTEEDVTSAIHALLDKFRGPKIRS